MALHLVNHGDVNFTRAKIKLTQISVNPLPKSILQARYAFWEMKYDNCQTDGKDKT
jgi:hypothetical protein